MPRDGSKNLIPFDQRSEEEQREMRLRGAQASAASRRKKRDAKKAMLLIMESMPKIDPKTKNIIEELGVKRGSKTKGFTIEDIENIALAQRAMKGDVKARKMQMEIIGEGAAFELARARLEIERMRLEIEKARAVGESNAVRPDDGFIAALNASGKEVWADDGKDEWQDTPRNLHDTPGGYGGEDGDEFDGEDDGGTDPEI